MSASTASVAVMFCSLRIHSCPRLSALGSFKWRVFPSSKSSRVGRDGARRAWWEPRVGSVGNRCEITARSQFPDDVPVAGPVGIIDLDRPVLGALGDHQVIVCGRPTHGVGVQPVGRDRVIRARRLVLSQGDSDPPGWKF